ncbi:hypothetical protein LCGC14_2250030 [marine sediment metagenome]|uniref:DUF3144 domain-containing protein n=1 Tax=marine sediment metagenome TaxID=412755 RepID=A0A0F9DQB7_9ZZZZ|nr:DUF3144 domain-containing protein [Methylophaga sp.]
MTDKEKLFFDRSDRFIHLANEQINEGIKAGQVSTAFMYGLARYTAWFTASGWTTAKDMADAKAETIDFFVTEYRQMLELNMDDYINQFDEYIQTSEKIQQQR